MAGAPIRAIAPVAASSVEHAQRRIALRLLPFVFILYIINYLDRTSVACAAIGMAINALASVAGFAGPYAFGYLHAETGSFVAGFTALMLCALAAAVFMLITPTARPRASESAGSTNRS